MKTAHNISNSSLIILASLFLVLCGNISFFSHVTEVYPITPENSVFLLSLSALFICINTILFSLVCFKRTTKPVLISILLISSLAAYFMDTYNVVIDDLMIDNIVKTDTNEALDLFSFKQIIYLLLLGILPSVLIYKVNITQTTFKRSLLSNALLFAGSLALSTILILSLSNFYASFFREHKPLRYYANPSYYIYSSIKYINSLFESSTQPLKKIGLDAKTVSDNNHRKLVILVVGETARSDHFSLNGYNKKTNPLLEKENVFSFDNVWSCGTSTAHSVPCMFSIYGRADFRKSKGATTENVLDILKRAGVNVVWLDNNSSSKGVAERVGAIDYKSPEINPVCDTECRDVGMLANLQTYIDSHSEGDIFIVLHQMGNHGPAYYKRYPKAFEAFTPTCQTNQLEQCTQEEIINAYDNALLYTDYFLSQTIDFLKTNDNQFKTAMLYISDHGESLGENNLYLHGMPYMIAPDEQTHVPMVMWFGDDTGNSGINHSRLTQKIHTQLSHDHLFHTVLGLMDIASSVYDANMDITKHEGSH